MYYPYIHKSDYYIPNWRRKKLIFEVGEPFREKLSFFIGDQEKHFACPGFSVVGENEMLDFFSYMSGISSYALLHISILDNMKEGERRLQQGELDPL